MRLFPWNFRTDSVMIIVLFKPLIRFSCSNLRVCNRSDDKVETFTIIPIRKEGPPLNTHSFSAAERCFLIFHSICFVSALFFLWKGSFSSCLVSVLLLGLSLPCSLLLQSAPPSDDNRPTQEDPQTAFSAKQQPSSLSAPCSLPAQSSGPESTSSFHHPQPTKSSFCVLPLPQEEAVSLNLLSLCETIARDFIALYDLYPSQVQIMSEEETMFLTTYRTLLTLTLRSLMDNGVKYAKHDAAHGARLSLTLTRQDADLLIIFRNNTCGLPPSELSGLTGLNRQGSNRISGTGLGLFQADAAVTVMGGTLTCKSSPGTGFAVYLRLPASLSQAEKGQPQSGQDTPGKEHVR